MAEVDSRALERAKARLDTLDYYPEPVRIDRVRVVVAPWFFRIPGFRRYRGYAFWRTIVLRDAAASDDLITHELCHIWQGQHRPADMSWKHVTTRYRSNPYEVEARRAVAETASLVSDAESDTRSSRTDGSDRPAAKNGHARGQTPRV